MATSKTGHRNVHGWTVPCTREHRNMNMSENQKDSVGSLLSTCVDLGKDISAKAMEMCAQLQTANEHRGMNLCAQWNLPACTLGENPSAQENEHTCTLKCTCESRAMYLCRPRYEKCETIIYMSAKAMYQTVHWHVHVAQSYEKDCTQICTWEYIHVRT